MTAVTLRLKSKLSPTTCKRERMHHTSMHWTKIFTWRCSEPTLVSTIEWEPNKVIIMFEVNALISKFCLTKTARKNMNMHRFTQRIMCVWQSRPAGQKTKVRMIVTFQCTSFCWNFGTILSDSKNFGVEFLPKLFHGTHWHDHSLDKLNNNKNRIEHFLMELNLATLKILMQVLLPYLFIIELSAHWKLVKTAHCLNLIRVAAFCFCMEVHLICLASVFSTQVVKLADISVYILTEKLLLHVLRSLSCFKT